jgi:squalene-associated FAD-dependent desaturase
LKRRRVAVVGAGWAGIAAAVHARRAGQEVTVFEMAPRPGGRARTVQVDGVDLDNGQHILVGAYRSTLALMRIVGADPDALLKRLPLALQTPDGHGLQLPAGGPVGAFVRGVIHQRSWARRDRLALLVAAASWGLRGFRCPSALTVAEFCATLPAPVRRDLIDPLCVAALNTPAEEASAAVMLRVLRDALFGGRGASDLLLPRPGLGALLPQPAARWFADQGVTLHAGRRVRRLAADGESWRVDGEAFDRVVVACSAAEASRLCAGVAPGWSATAAALRYEPIVTVYLRSPQARWPRPIVALRCGADAPAQFAFDLGALGGPAGLFSFVVSGARGWVERGLDATAHACRAQALAAFPAATWPQAPVVLHVAAEKRATFRCTPALRRPPAFVAPGLRAAGDYVEGPYPATLEGAVRSGEDAARAFGSD